MMNMHSPRNQGNVLFLILIAVALFAALSYVIAHMSRASGSSKDRESTRLEVSRALNYITAVRSAVLRLKLSGCTHSQISFDGAIESAGHDFINPLAPPDERCHVHSAKGGGVPIDKPAIELFSDTSDPYYFYTGNDAITNIGTTCADPKCAELSMNLWGLTDEACMMFNKLSATGLGSTIPADNISGCPFHGTYDCSGNGVAAISFTDPSLEGKHEACIYNTVWSMNVYNAVLLDR